MSIYRLFLYNISGGTDHTHYIGGVRAVSGGQPVGNRTLPYPTLGFFD
jgi:hypothetical protein